MVAQLPPMDATALAAAVRSGAMTPQAVCETAIDAIVAQNPALNAVVALRPDDSRVQAEHVAARLRAGDPLPLAGVPLLVKDAIWVEGWPATQGSRLFAEFIAPQDGLVVARLKRAGAVVVGMANMSEFGCKGVTSNPLHGVTRHPLDPTLTSGGSSGGCATAVAAGFAPLALCTDGGGSTRRPAAHVGVVGFKPSGGIAPNGPGFPGGGSLTSVLAPMARRVADTMAMFDVMAGSDPSDPWSCDLPHRPRQPMAELRVAYSPSFGLDVPVDAVVATRTEAAVARLRAAGWRIEAVDPAWPEGASEAALMPMQWAGLAQLHGAVWREQPDFFDPNIAEQIGRGMRLSAGDLTAAQAMAGSITQAAARFFGQGYDLVIGPTTPCVAWPHDRLGPETIAGVPVHDRAHAAFTPFFNHALCPAISIPNGGDAAGLPIGLQIAGPRFADHLVLAAALDAETILEFGR